MQPAPQLCGMSLVFMMLNHSDRLPFFRVTLPAWEFLIKGGNQEGAKGVILCVFFEDHDCLSDLCTPLSNIHISAVSSIKGDNGATSVSC